MLDRIEQSLRQLVFTCANVKRQEKVLIVTNPALEDIALKLAQVAGKTAQDVEVHFIKDASIHGEEPPANVAKKMKEADVIFGLTRQSMAHTQARLQASRRGARYLSLPDYSLAVLKSPAMNGPFRKLSNVSQKMADIFSKGNDVLLITKKGTHLTANIKGRKGNAAPGWCGAKGTLASPPDAESNVALIEDKSEGILIVDGSIPCQEIGLLTSPQELRIKDGRVVEIKGNKASILKKLFGQTNSKTRILAELGVGLNPMAKLCGRMLEDEGCLGTAHIGIGSNATIGGKNDVPFHLDFVMRNVTLKVDGRSILENGKLKI
jgi:2,5-dihydroxypyridine 5,6-dioxygenase